VKTLERLGIAILFITVLMAVLVKAKFTVPIVFVFLVAASVGSVMLIFPDNK
jgi:hypothetical protein